MTMDGGRECNGLGGKGRHKPRAQVSHPPRNQSCFLSFMRVSCSFTTTFPGLKIQCWAAGEVSHVLTTLANEVAGPVPWIWHESALEHSHCSPAPGRELSGLSEHWPGSLGQMQSTRCRSFDSGYSDVFVEVQEFEKKMYLAYWLFVLLLFPLPGNSDPHD